MVELDASPRPDEVGRFRPVGDRGGEVDYFEHPLERHERGQDVDPGVGELREWLVDQRDVRGERGEGARGDGARDREVAPDVIDDCGADRGDEPQRNEEYAAVDRGCDADVAHAARAGGERAPLPVGVTEQLGEHRAGHVEPFGGDVVHLRVLLHADPSEFLDARPEQASRIDERGKREKCEERDLPAEPEHDRERHHQLYEVLHHGAECVRDRLLRADDVVVQPRLQCSRLRAGEEGDRHALHVVEQLHAQVVDQPLADARGVVALGE